MRFEGSPVPGGCWVEIVRITNKDGSPLAPDNWRKKLFGRVTMCWIAGGFRQRGAFFKGKIRMENGEPVEIDLEANRWCSTTEAQPIEIEPGIFDFETNTSVYRFRLLTEEEVKAIEKVINVIIEKKLKIARKLMEHLAEPPTGSSGKVPVS